MLFECRFGSLLDRHADRWCAEKFRFRPSNRLRVQNASSHMKILEKFGVNQDDLRELRLEAFLSFPVKIVETC